MLGLISVISGAIKQVLIFTLCSRVNFKLSETEEMQKSRAFPRSVWVDN